MTPRSVRRLRAMDAAELAWRGRAAGRIAFDRARAAVRAPSWNREDLRARIRGDHHLVPLRAALAQRRWDVAHTMLASYVATEPQRFIIAPQLRSAASSTILREFPDAARDAAALADRVTAGDYDLLGYRGLRFDTAVGAPDWHYDPVHARRAPRRFWTAVPYLDPSFGDHKIIWELNRHQHWLVLGRAYWLTGNATYRQAVVRQLASWLEQNPPLLGINWASMLELAFRSLSWIWAVNFFSTSVEDGETWLVDLMLALDRQLEHIERNLSFYFSPNTHLLGEALALYVGGRTLPLLSGSGRRERIGRRVLIAEIDRQIGPDGGHVERSTHYHRYTLDFYLLALAVARLTGDEAAAEFQRAVARLAFAARLLADDRGRLPHIGDDDGGMAFPLAGRPAEDVRDSLAAAAALVARPELRVGATPEEAFWLLAHPSLSNEVDAAAGRAPLDSVASDALPATGYYVSRSAAGDHLVVDGGPHGYQNAGHAHADALSMTLTIRGMPVIEDPGTGSYTADAALRDRLRSTRLHNTLTLDERSQSIPEGPFHWTHTADASVRRWRTNAGFDYFDGAHDGYRPLEHRRHVLALHGDAILVGDLVAGDRTVHRADVHWHIHRAWQVSLENGRATLSARGESIQMFVPQGVLELFTGDSENGLGWQAPVYGRIEAAPTIRISHSGSAPLWTFTVFGVNPSNEIKEVDTAPVWAEAGLLEHSVALRITRAASIDYWLIAEPAHDPDHRVWRVGEIETDARMLFCRTRHDGQVTRVALVDGSLVRASGHRKLLVSLPRTASDAHVDLSKADETARLSGPTLGARVQVGGRDCALDVERRAAVRLQS
jgi:hypothetical protein